MRRFSSPKITISHRLTGPSGADGLVVWGAGVDAGTASQCDAVLDYMRSVGGHVLARAANRTLAQLAAEV